MKLVPLTVAPSFTRYATYAVPPSGDTSSAHTVASLAAYWDNATASSSAFVKFLDHVAVDAVSSR